MTEPIILLGAARSGTKYLRDLLATADGVAAVPYDVNYVWRYGAENVKHDVLNAGTLTERRRAFIRKTLPSLAKASPKDVLIEKTVANPLRVPFVEAVYPEARYVHLVRDGRDVAESAMRMWQAPPDWLALWTKLKGIPLSNLGYACWFGKNFLMGLLSGRKGGNVWGPRFVGVDEMISQQASLAQICATQWARTEGQARKDLMNIPRERVFRIRYEDLIAGENALSELVDSLSLPNKDQILAAHKSRLRPSPPSQWQKLPMKDQEAFSLIMDPVLKQAGYI